MKTKFNLVGNTFTHLTGGNKGYAVHGKESTYVKWVFDGTGIATFYVDNHLRQALTDENRGPKYGWLLESRSVTPQIIDEIKTFSDKYLAACDLIFTHNQELLALDPNFRWCPAAGFWIKEPKIYEKTKLISMISSNKSWTQGHQIRLHWVTMLRNHIDLYGRGFNEIETKEEGLCDYMFSVVIENGFYESYYTEKILDCFATGTIPIYLGAPDIATHFNSDGIIRLTNRIEVSREIYTSRLEAVRDNLERAKAMEIPEDFIYLHYFQ